MFWFNLIEHIHMRASQWLRVQRDPRVYFIWSNTVDLERPPATGDPPPPLLAARQEIAEIKSRWHSGA